MTVRIRTTHPAGYRCGEWADLVATLPVRGRECFVVRFDDGVTDYWPSSEDRYEFDAPWCHDEPVTEPPSFTCPRCGRTSYNRTDIDEGYCGACHDWTARAPSWPHIPPGWTYSRLFGGIFPEPVIPAACYQSEYGFDVHIRGACRCQR